MLKLSSKEINTLYEALTSYLGKNPDSIRTIIPLLEKLYETGKVKIEGIQKTPDQQPINESVSEQDFLKEYYQIEDTVRLNKEKGFIIGQIEGKNLVMVQGNTYLVDDKDLTEYKKKVDLATLKVPHMMKCDEETQKLLFEQMVRCGVYMENVPVKLTDCFVKFSSWEKAKDDQQVKVLIEGNTSFLPKSQVRIFENLDDFANPDNYVPGVIIDEASEDALENVLINAIDYSGAIGDADAVKIIRKSPEGVQEIQTMPKASLRTLSV